MFATNFASYPQQIKWSHNYLKNYIGFQLTYNIVTISLYYLGVSVVKMCLRFLLIEIREL